MSTTKPNTRENKSLNELDKKVHELNYIESPSGTRAGRQTPDPSVAKDLAKKIRKNIEAYQSEVSLSQRSHIQAQ